MRPKDYVWMLKLWHAPTDNYQILHAILDKSINERLDLASSEVIRCQPSRKVYNFCKISWPFE
ncbi:MAG: hypothetical protein ACTS45_01070 [Candidatus Hodgkinia cicadicola]